jgi:flavin reductase (DIM6/NTAB) family NADH-FMN oxidoreductase RutF
MFYDTLKNDHGLPYNPFKACVVPRPIGWVSTLSHDGVPNLAPFSIFNQIAFDPPFVFFAGNSHSSRENGRTASSMPRRRASS